MDISSGNGGSPAASRDRFPRAGLAAGLLALAVVLAACGQAQRAGPEEERADSSSAEAAPAVEQEATVAPESTVTPSDQVEAPAGREASETARLAEAAPVEAVRAVEATGVETAHVEAIHAVRAVEAPDAGVVAGTGERAWARRASVAASAPASASAPTEPAREDDGPPIAPIAPVYPIAAASPAPEPAADVPAASFRIGWAAGVWPRIDCPPDCAPVATVARGRSYRLDLAVVGRAVQAPVSVILAEQLGELQEGRALVVNLVPIFADGVSPVPGDRTTAYPLVLRRPPSPPAPPAGDRETGMGADGTRPDDAGTDASVDRVFGRQSIPFLVNAHARGCAQIVLSVWNEEMTIALDGLVVTMPIDGFFGQTSCRHPEDHERRLQAPVVRSMADVVDVLARPSGVADDVSHVGLHVFEVGASRGDSYAVMVMQPREGERQVAGWRLVSSIGDSFRATAEFQERVTADRSYLSQVERGHWAYQKTARFIKDKLFSAQASSQLPGMSAEQAFAALKALAESDEDTVVSAQFFVPGRGGDSERMYLPLRMLAAPGSKLIANDFTLVEPISAPGARVPGCISRWHVLIGDSVDETSEDEAIVNSIRGFEPVAWRGPVLTRHQEVEAFFAGPGAGQEDGPGAEGLILVAHHGTDGIEIERRIGEKIDIEDIRRRFAPGSVAFLAACNTASPNASDGLIQRLHRNDVESFIASPLSVPTGYGLVLAEQLMIDIDRAYRSGDTPTLQALYARAVENTARRYAEKHGFVGDGHLHHEYVLIGDPSIRLCPLPPFQSPEHEEPVDEDPVQP